MFLPWVVVVCSSPRPGPHPTIPSRPLQTSTSTQSCPPRPELGEPTAVTREFVTEKTFEKSLKVWSEPADTGTAGLLERGTCTPSICCPAPRPACSAHRTRPRSIEPAPGRKGRPRSTDGGTRAQRGRRAGTVPTMKRKSQSCWSRLRSSSKRGDRCVTGSCAPTGGQWPCHGNVPARDRRAGDGVPTSPRPDRVRQAATCPGAKRPSSACYVRMNSSGMRKIDRHLGVIWIDGMYRQAEGRADRR
jgi:hypothetical protein